MEKTLKGYATELNPTTQIVCAYASGSRTLYSGSNRWQAIGSFTVPEFVGGARLSVFATTTLGCTLHVAIYDPEIIVNSEVVFVPDSDEQERVSPQRFDLEADKVYQIAAWADCASVNEAIFAVVRTCSLV